MRKYLRIGKIISLHGIKGEVKIFPTTDNIKRFNDLKSLYILTSEDANENEFEDATIYESVGVKYIKNTCILKIKNFDTIEESTKLIGKSIYVKREDAIPLKSDEYYVVDLIGIKAYMKDEYIGNVKDVMKSKYYNLLVIDYNNKELLVPMVCDYIEDIDIQKSIIKIKTIDGLI